MRALYFHPAVSSSSSSSSSFLPRLISVVAEWMSTIFYTSCGLSANLECMFEMCCTRLARNTGRENDAKNRHLRTIAQFCRAVSSQPSHILTIEKKLLNSNISSTCPHNMANFGPLTTEIGLVVWGTLTNFNGFRILPCMMFGRLLGWYTMYTFSGALAP